MTCSYSSSLCLAVIIALPAATPKEFRNTASYALGNFTNSEHSQQYSNRIASLTLRDLQPVAGLVASLSSSVSWHRSGLSVSLSANAPVRCYSLSSQITIGSFDSSVHISEEASNAATAVPWAIVYAIGIAGVLGWGQLRSLAS